MKLIRKDKKGFTLVELIVVIAILAILALILIPAITGYVDKANKSKNQANARGLYSQANFEIYTYDGTVDQDAIVKIEKDIKPKVGDVKIKYDTTTGKLEYVTYYPSGDKTKPKDAMTFDGSGFNPGETPKTPSGGGEEGSGPKATH